MRSAALAVCAAALLTGACSPRSQNAHTDIDRQLQTEINSIRAIDNHAHPMRAVSEGEKDTEFDALAVDLMEPYDTAPLRLRADNAEYTDIAQRLFHGEKARVMKERGDGYPSWVLDQLGIDIMFANRVAMGRGLPAQRFQWVPYADALMYPLDNQELGKRDPDRKVFFAAEERLLKRYLQEAGGDRGLPKTLDEYLRFVDATFDGWKRKGAIAVKLEMAYLRSLEVGNPEQSAVARTYARYVNGGVPPEAEYKALQDFLFRHVAAQCGRLGMPLHFHSSAGAGRYFDVGGVRPTLLMPVLVDPALSKTKFVYVHGAWPYTKELTALLDMPNVYADFSAQTSILYPRAVAEVLRGWLEYAPEKVLFGTDASPLSDRINWEETGELAAATGREALAMALTGMLRDGEITRPRATELARMVMRDNARRLYGLQ